MRGKIVNERQEVGPEMLLLFADVLIMWVLVASCDHSARNDSVFVMNRNWM